MSPDIQKNFRIVGDELKRSRAIVDMAASQNTTIDYNADDSRLNWPGKDPNLQADWAVSSATYGYGKLIGWQLIEGRDFSPSFPTDSTGLIVNEAAVRQLGFRHPVGQTIEWKGRQFHIIGVIRNIIFESPYTVASSPSIYHLAADDNYVVTLKLNPELGTKAALASVQAVFARYNPSYPFYCRFVDQEYAKKFAEEEQIATLAGLFTLLAILTSCLGLFGLVSFMAEQRKKEISIRKVLGASEFNLWGLLSKDFVRLVVLALVLAAPIAYYMMHNWLRQYEYRYRISWTVFVIAGSSALLVALLTVSYEAIKAATASPVKNLRAE
jgi:putative ABC transport system permease protein